MQLTQWLGRAASVAVAPLSFTTAALRRARVFHPRGLILRANAIPHDRVPIALRTAAQRLTGTALVRLSSALYERERGRRPDLLGVGITIRGGGPEQDLLFASARSLLTLPVSLFTTNVQDFLANEYFAIAPFDLDGVGRVRLRLRPSRPAQPSPQLDQEVGHNGHHARADGAPDASGVNGVNGVNGVKGAIKHLVDREQRIDAAVARGGAGFDLEVRVGRGAWTPLLTIELFEEVELPDEALELTPFHDGRGLRPVGFVNAVRRLTYAASRAGRRLTRRGSRRPAPV